MKVNDSVVLKQPIINGLIIKTRYNEDALELEHLVEYIDTDKSTNQRWFLESQLEIL